MRITIYKRDGSFTVYETVEAGPLSGDAELRNAGATHILGIAKKGLECYGDYIPAKLVETGKGKPPSPEH
jgi:hypothetical protein